MARLGLRVSEVCRLHWTTSTGAGGGLGSGSQDWPWSAASDPCRGRRALADYLERGRPDTTAREVFVLFRLRRCSGQREHRGAGRGKGAPPGWDRGGHAWREPVAPLEGHRAAGPGSRLGEIAGLLGHTRLATTRIYAAVDIEALREVALPWPGKTS